MLLKIVNSLLGGLLTAFLGWVLAYMSIYYGTPSGDKIVYAAFYVIGCLGFFVALTSPNIAKAWRRIFFMSAAILAISILVLFSPINQVQIDTPKIIFKVPSVMELATVEGLEVIALFCALSFLFAILGMAIGKIKEKPTS